MRASISRIADRLLGRTRLGLLPVRVRDGIAAGAKWTLYPKTSYWRGTHEPLLQREPMQLGGGDIRGWTCWDLGAHFGLYSVGLARRVGPTGFVAGFEPDPVSFARFDRHRRMNDVPWLKAYGAAVSDISGNAEVFTYGEPGATTTHLPYPGETRTNAVGALQVATVKLDDLVGRGEIRAPQFVKVDVEGHGDRAFAGMRMALAASRPVCIVALHCQSEIDGVLRVLQPLGYSWREIGATIANPALRIGDYVFTPSLRSSRA